MQQLAPAKKGPPFSRPLLRGGHKANLLPGSQLVADLQVPSARGTKSLQSIIYWRFQKQKSRQDNLKNNNKQRLENISKNQEFSTFEAVSETFFTSHKRFVDLSYFCAQESVLLLL